MTDLHQEFFSKLAIAGALVAKSAFDYSSMWEDA
jgi:hypothetical protein